MKTNLQINYENTPFLETGRITAETPLNRLNWRCEILLTKNKEAIKGKRVLDLASHDGVFSYACLKLGASHVTGVEGRRSLINSANDNLASLGFNKEQFTFIEDDVFDYLKGVKTEEFDTILCFGIFYHTIRHAELLKEIKRIHPEYIILDTFIQRGYFLNLSSTVILNALKLLPKLKIRNIIHPSKSLKNVNKSLSYEPIKPLSISRKVPCIVLLPETDVKEWGTIDLLKLGAWPTHAFLELLFQSHGFSIERLIWYKKEIDDWTAITDYKDGRRASYLARPRN
ncbi:MAG: methyltransferase domain-containing protein [Dehalococcoidales bacterium]|nr:methyltransferase domain-containing protein [Dehalococcoidales bacterium]